MKKVYVKVFDYIPELDAFAVRKEFKSLVNKLGLTEWNPVVFLGRYFCLDNDYGEHWFDNHELREEIDAKASELGYNSEELYVIDPARFQDGTDGPCHTDKLRKQFWTDVLTSLVLSEEFLRNESKENKMVNGKKTTRQ